MVHRLVVLALLACSGGESTPAEPAPPVEVEAATEVEAVTEAAQGAGDAPAAQDPPAAGEPTEPGVGDEEPGDVEAAAAEEQEVGDVEPPAASAAPAEAATEAADGAEAATDGADPAAATDGADPDVAGDGADPAAATDGANPDVAGDGADPEATTEDGADPAAIAGTDPADAEPAVPAARTYTLSAARSRMTVVIRSDPTAALARLGHDHVIQASTMSGTVTWPTVAGGPCSVDIRVPVRGLVVDPAGARKRAGLDPDGGISDSEEVKLAKNMWSKSQLDAGSHPEISFQAATCPGGTGQVEVAGTLSIRGVSAPRSVTMTVEATAEAFSASGRFTTAHTAFGFKPFSATPLGPRNQDALAFSLSVKGSAE